MIDGVTLYAVKNAPVDRNTGPDGGFNIYMPDAIYWVHPDKPNPCPLTSPLYQLSVAIWKEVGALCDAVAGLSTARVTVSFGDKADESVEFHGRKGYNQASCACDRVDGGWHTSSINDLYPRFEQDCLCAARHLSPKTLRELFRVEPVTQAASRCHRTGQQDIVLAQPISTRGSIDEHTLARAYEETLREFFGGEDDDR